MTVRRKNNSRSPKTPTTTKSGTTKYPETATTKSSPTSSSPISSIDNSNLPMSITTEELEKVVQRVINKELKSALNKHLNETIESLRASLEEVSNIAKSALKLAEEQKVVIEELKTSKGKIESAPSRISDLEELIEERTNRQLRKTLVFHGISSEADNSKYESWKDTEVLVRKTISKILSIPYEKTDMIERCHRGARSPNYKGNLPNPIYAAVYDWKDCELIMEKFREHNMSNRDSSLRAEYKYGPLTTKRRSLALNERRTLKQNGAIISGYVAYPARLMVKTEPAGKYSEYKDFSKTKIDFKKKKHT